MRDCAEFDACELPAIPRREATRLVSVSQAGAGAWIDAVPNLVRPVANPGTSDLYLTMCQRRLGLHLSVVPDDDKDKLGDVYANDGEHSRRHNAVMHAWRDAAADVAPASVVLGDKHATDPLPSHVQHMASISATYIPDIYVEGGAARGRDLLLEVRCYTPFVRHLSAGTLGSHASVGDTFPFGNTEERIRCDALGVTPSGRPGDPWLDHRTGIGRVKGQTAQYSHAISSGRTVTPVVMEPTGAVGPHAYAMLRGWSRTSRAKKKEATRRKFHWSAPTYFTYHLQRISTAAVAADAQHILNMIQVARFTNRGPTAPTQTPRRATGRTF